MNTRTYRNTLLSLTTASMLSACNVGEETITPIADIVVPVDSQEIVASEDFVFNLDRQIQLDVLSSDRTDAVIKIYRSMVPGLPNGIIAADPMSLISTYRYPMTTNIDITVSAGWEHLVVEVIHESGQPDLVQLLTLTDMSDEYTLNL